MTSSSLPSSAPERSLDEHRQQLRQEMIACRQSTLNLIQDLTDAEFYQQAHPDFSPVGWHLGHIGFAESLWLLEHLQRSPCPYPQYQQLFAADGLPKAQRQNLPTLSDLLAFITDVRDRTLAYLETAPLETQLRLWRWLLQHESQHAETATYLLALHRWQTPKAATTQEAVTVPLPVLKMPSTENMVRIAGGEFTMGTDTLDALDNEQPVCLTQVDDFWLDQTPVTVAAYTEFMAAGGYDNSQWWHPEGWIWRQRYEITQPLYWRCGDATEALPVCGVSWYEADAYACFMGKRLPSEVEWERAARWHPEQQVMQSMPWGNGAVNQQRGNFGGDRGDVTQVGQFPAGRSATGCDDLLGNVWEWTSTWFAGYPGFQAYPYKGYSQAYFDRAHRVLRGGSWATRPWVLRPTFRNWYQPHVQQVFAGFRCALEI
ncbi:MAG: SUMF1/EgtB/PvdO family nonheme iron enzyme [Cyanobacteria bacterium P01_C01_bin.120]